MRPPVDASKLSEAAKASAGELGEALQRLATLAPAKDVLTNAEFRNQLEHTLAVSKQVNEVMGSQRFPMPLQDTWGQLREALNNLARVYKVETLAVLEIPGAAGSGRGRGGRGANAAAAGGRGGARGAVPPGAIVGYIVDQMCAKRGKQMWTNAQCVQKCMRDGDKIVLVTEEGKIYQIANQDKITPDTYGLSVAVTGKTEGDTITIENLTL
jgi:hypothetical protein